MIPTPEQFKQEVESGPLSAECALGWGLVFQDEEEVSYAAMPSEAEPTDDQIQNDPSLMELKEEWNSWRARRRWEVIHARAGCITPDGCQEVLSILSDPSKRQKAFPMTVATFTVFLASRGLLRKIKRAVDDVSLTDTVRDVCDLVVTLTQSSPDRQIDPNNQEHSGMILVLVQSGIATQQHVTEFMTECMKPCSRLDELGWSQPDYNLVNTARKLS